MTRLEEENRQLRARLLEMTEAAARNERLLRKTQARELELLRAGSIVQLLDLLINGLRESYALAAVGLVLQDPHHELRHLLVGDGFTGEMLRAIRFVDTLADLEPPLAGLDRPWLGAWRAAEHEQIFAAGRPLGSVALIPLPRRDRLEGILAFGSHDRRRFTDALASDFLGHLGVIVAVCIESTVNRARLLRSGMTDFLTGWHNRRYLHARLQEELARAQRSEGCVACLMIDVDHFKRINDQHGHLAGDQVLKEVARRIDTEIRAADTGARFGGDEFAIVLAGAGLEESEALARRVHRAVTAWPVAVSAACEEPVTVSIGVAVARPGREARDHAALAEQLLAEADAALYRVKTAGRNGVGRSGKLVA
ncbi:MAG: sensor domain-containing diguanylate cyclase [Gammaproteobacteria bacterium]|nr:sensor domain-containing diguanylate cyclase [Gammaproteobacteria bacterium]